jgi:hypothetical protein
LGNKLPLGGGLKYGMVHCKMFHKRKLDIFPIIDRNWKIIFKCCETPFKKNNYSTEREIELKTSRLELNDMLRRRAKFIMQRVRQIYYFQGSRPSHLLALQLKHTETRSSI